MGGNERDAGSLKARRRFSDGLCRLGDAVEDGGGRLPDVVVAVGAAACKLCFQTACRLSAARINPAPIPPPATVVDTRRLG